MHSQIKYISGPEKLKKNTFIAGEWQVGVKVRIDPSYMYWVKFFFSLTKDMYVSDSRRLIIYVFLLKFSPSIDLHI